MRRLLLLFLAGCSDIELNCSPHKYTVTETGQCVFNRYGDGSCTVLLDNEIQANFSNPSVKGAKVFMCKYSSGDVTYRRAN